jgi:hypothetical protein
MLSEVFWIAFVSSTTALVLGIARMAYKSKCTTVDCCCIKIVRDVQTEEKEFEILRNKSTDFENKV